jgi:hypothetical protein
LAASFDDPARATTRKAVLLVTDGQPTFLTRNNTTDCQQQAKDNSALPSPFNSGGPNGCKMGVPTYPNANSARFLYRGPLTSGDSGLVGITSNTCTTVTCKTFYLNTIGCTRSITGCQTNGAMHEANLIRNCGSGNSACATGGSHDVVFFAIIIGKKDVNDPQGSADENAKCLLARMANATDIMNAGTGVVETISAMCNAKFQTIDEDTHADLIQSWPACAPGVASPCIDPTQQKGKV